MRKSFLIQVVICTMLVVQGCCFVSVKQSEVAEMSVPIGACVDKANCGADNHFVGADNGPSVDKDEIEHQHTARSVYTQSGDVTYSHSSKLVAPAETKASPVAVFNAAIQLWEKAEKINTKIGHLHKAVNQIQSELQLNKKAIEAAILDLQDQLEDEVFQVTDRFQPLEGKPAKKYPSNSPQMIAQANKVVNDVLESYNHLAKVVVDRIKAGKEPLPSKARDTAKRSLAPRDVPKSVEFGLQKLGLFHVGLFQLAVVVIGFVCGGLVISMIIRKREKQMSLPFTIYDN